MLLRFKMFSDNGENGNEKIWIYGGFIMANYVLVHGGRSNGHVWSQSQVVPLLQEHGHHVFYPTLSRPENSGLSDHISEVCSLIENEHINNVILVGHSYGAMVITGVADRMPEKIDRLIYVDSVVPENGKALYDFFDPAKYGLEPLKPFIEPLYFDEEKIKRIPKTYIHCKRSEFLEVGEGAFKSVFDRAKQDNWSYFELNTSHKCMVTQPKELTEILLGIK